MSLNKNFNSVTQSAPNFRQFLNNLFSKIIYIINAESLNIPFFKINFCLQSHNRNVQNYV